MPASFLLLLDDAGLAIWSVEPDSEAAPTSIPDADPPPPIRPAPEGQAIGRTDTRFVATHWLSCRTDADGSARFADFLTRHPRAHYRLLVDSAEENYVLTDFERPPRSTAFFWLGLGRSLRTSQRRMQQLAAQHFPQTPYLRGEDLHPLHRTLRRRPRTGNEHAIVQLSALSAPARWQCWLDVLHAQAVPLLGIESVPHVLERLLCSSLQASGAATHRPIPRRKQHIGRPRWLPDFARAAPPPHLLLVLPLSGGMRYGYLREGHLCFLRTVSGKETHWDTLRNTLGTELAQIWHYLNRQLFAAQPLLRPASGAAVVCWVLGAPRGWQPDIAAFQAAAPPGPLTISSTANLLASLRLRCKNSAHTAPEEDFLVGNVVDALQSASEKRSAPPTVQQQRAASWAGLTASLPAHNDYALPAQLRIARQLDNARRLRTGALWITGCAAGIGVLLAAQAWHVAQRAAQIRTTTQAHQQTRNDALRATGFAEHDPAALDQLPPLLDRLRENPRLPSTLFWLATQLTAHPQLRIDALAWERTAWDARESSVSLTLWGHFHGRNAQAENALENTRRESFPPLPPTPSNLAPDTATAQAELDRLLAHWQKTLPALRIERLQMPLNDDPRAALHIVQTDIAQPEGSGSGIPFAIRLIGLPGQGDAP